MTLPGWVLLFSSGVGVIAGILIGAIGVGGIVIVPALTLLNQIDIQTAIASAMFSYIGAGLVGLIMYARAGSIQWPSVTALMLAAAPGAFTAAFILQYLGELVIKSILYALMFGSSVLALVRVVASWRAGEVQEVRAHTSTLT